MSVYVDPLMNHGGSATFRWKMSCHLFADTVEELHAFARKIGMKRAWFQTPEKFPHYDLNEGRRRAAVAAGVIELNLHDAVAKRREIKAALHAPSKPIMPIKPEM